ncbi:replication region DNA-binding N-term [Onishia taeanensis]|uniref:Replication region DNA-binding N-term n=1 Tax=Onishia taeanensis TaxID=284577 RepID=A0A1G7QDD6_9GAMM|nr:DNA-binding protein [Halomonas taeanensis]SDF95600.1 replication region DNA-binding N-term [Halomonas taeanensis]
MARSGVQYEDVQRAIHTLLSRGDAPSVQRIREVLGTGSFTTLSEHLRQWRVEREENRDQPPAQELPEALQTLTQELWRQAQDTASEGLALYRQEADQRISEAQEAARESDRRAEDAGQREAAVADHLANAQARLEEQSATLASCQAQRDSLAEREAKALQQVQQLEKELKRLQDRNEALAAQHHEALTARDTEHQARLHQEEQRNEAAEARLMSLLDDARQERHAADKQHGARQAQLEARNENLDKQLQELRTQLADSQQQQREAHWELEQRKEQDRDRKRHQDRLEHRLEEKDAEIAALKKRLLETEARLAKTPLPPFVY